MTIQATDKDDRRAYVSACAMPMGKSPKKKIPPIYPSVGKKLQLLKSWGVSRFKVVKL